MRAPGAARLRHTLASPPVPTVKMPALKVIAGTFAGD